jgi:D-amino-acid dehydrogenase
MMRTLKEQIVKRGGRIHYNHTFEGVVQKGDSCKQVIAGNQSFTADHFILAPGSWLQPLAGKFGISLLLQPGKGYSVTYPKPGAGIAHPAILIDDRVALTPLENSIRVGGTMELGGIYRKKSASQKRLDSRRTRYDRHLTGRSNRKTDFSNGGR